MKLNESQAESLELLYANLRNAQMYAEDLMRSGPIKDAIHKVQVKIDWSVKFLENAIPSHKRGAAREIDHLYYDQISRLVTHMDEETKNKLEKFINEL
jgi:hypothetical protein